MRLPAACFAIAATVAFGALAEPAHAQSDDDRATARALGQEGQQALDAKDYRTAEDRYRRADKLVHAPTLMLGLARSLAAEGKYVEAQETYNRMVREGLPPGAPDVFKHALEEAKKEVEAVTPKVSGVTITVKAAAGGDIPDPKVVLDEHPINAASLGVRRSIDPGSHVLRASADGFKTAEKSFTVLEGGSVDEPITLEKDTSAPAGPAPVAGPAPAGPVSLTGSSTAPEATPSGKHSALPWVAFGIGGAGLIFGGITGLLAVGDHSTLANHCTNGTCPPSQDSNLSSYHTMGALSTVGFIVGGVGVAAGVVLLVTQPKGEPSTTPATATGFQIAPAIGLGSVGAVGTF
ncbi:MAG: hypothetical protein ACLP1X_18135 [Polyangiaceae bacterium]|jgi:hypothetical protein